MLRLTHFRKAGDSAKCRATAEMLEKLNRTAAVQAKTPGTDAGRLAQEDADRAIEWLQKAVQSGFEDAAHMKQDTDLDFLRDRADFKMLLSELEKAQKK